MDGSAVYDRAHRVYALRAVRSALSTVDTIGTWKHVRPTDFSEIPLLSRDCEQRNLWQVPYPSLHSEWSTRGLSPGSPTKPLDRSHPMVCV